MMKTRRIAALILISALGLALFFVYQKSDSKISEKDAVAKIRSLPEVVDYLKRVPEGRVEVSGEEANAYLIQVYEIKDNHTATFNWYSVDKTTGEIKELFP